MCETHARCVRLGRSGSVAKYGRFNLPGSFVPGGGRLGLKYGSSRKIRDIWQPYLGVLLAGFESIIYLFTAECLHTRDQRRCESGIADRDPQNIWNPRKNCGSFVALHRQILNK